MPAQRVSLDQENNWSRSPVIAWISYLTRRQQLLNLVLCEQTSFFDPYPREQNYCALINLLAAPLRSCADRGDASTTVWWRRRHSSVSSDSSQGVARMPYSSTIAIRHSTFHPELAATTVDFASMQILERPLALIVDPGSAAPSEVAVS
jgi:hypothetical protein